MIGHAIFDLTVLGPAAMDGVAAGAALSAARAGGSVAFLSGTEPAGALALRLQRAGVTVRAEAPLLVRAGRVLLVDSALWQREDGHRRAAHARAIARAAGRQVVLALCDAAATHRHRLSLLGFLRSGVDLLLCQPLEACALYDTHRVDTTVPKIRRDCRAAVLDRGSSGLILVGGDGVRLVEAAPVAPAAGAYAGAIVLAQSWGRDLAESCRLAGGLLAAAMHRHEAGVARPRLSLPDAGAAPPRPHAAEAAG
jgi:sugar/nucleoside kinase (ribokinase family)